MHELELTKHKSIEERLDSLFSKTSKKPMSDKKYNKVKKSADKHEKKFQEWKKK